MPAAEMRGLGRALAVALFVLTLAQRAFCAADIRRRAAADTVRPGDVRGLLPFSEVSVAIALSNRSRSWWSSFTIASRFAICQILALQPRLSASFVRYRVLAGAGR
jgi:hypothetical protein